jgi:acetyltransferase-like isoleucine patch superfamily enzyme
MYNFVKKIVNYLFLKYMYRNEVIFSFSVNIGTNSIFEGMNKLYPKVYFSGKLGTGSYIGPRSHISGEIGRYTSIGPDVKVIKGTHPYTLPFVTTSPAFYSLNKQNGFTYTNIQRFDEYLLVDKNNGYSAKVGNDCWLGERVLIIGGVTIGDGAMVLAGAVVTHNVPPFAIVGGVPAKILKYRYDQETITFLESLKWWDKDVCWMKTNIELMNDMSKLKKEFN